MTAWHSLQTKFGFRCQRFSSHRCAAWGWHVLCALCGASHSVSAPRSPDSQGSLASMAMPYWTTSKFSSLLKAQGEMQLHKFQPMAGAEQRLHA